MWLAHSLIDVQPSEDSVDCDVSLFACDLAIQVAKRSMSETKLSTSNRERGWFSESSELSFLLIK
jgi:hypothetical protein